ncbi:hypothetical protein DL89DRAFT_265470 [Linderina pennispora]|uniref:ClpP/crotonase n=1 Tax=Linderina pennispora TaxID=61395 RepID=A0A1Y1WJ87_9FUNG|nr:uncharacterized protein DL89DRAFT_265470 [Linderina pennispora]ORX73398.1 hypothetical protein DL89DRAFT_265470 [Linderina pennispora]
MVPAVETPLVTLTRPRHSTMAIDNRVTVDLIHDINQCLTIIEAELSAAPESKLGGAVVVTGHGKQLEDHSLNIRAKFHKLLARFLLFRTPVIGALNGHTVMRKDRGFICLNEVDIRRPLLPGMAAVKALRDSVLGGKRFSAEEAMAAEFVDEAVDGDKVVEVALDLAEKYAPKTYRDNYHLLKAELYRDALPHLLSQPLQTAGQYLAKL